MTKILFVCHGNICRSPMAEFVMKDLINKLDIASEFLISSKGTSSEELGNSVYPPVRKLLNEKGIDTKGKQARRLEKADYEKYDYIIGMDSANMRNMLKLFGGDSENKLSLLLSHSNINRDVADPWYTGNFIQTYDDVLCGCRAFLEKII